MKDQIERVEMHTPGLKTIITSAMLLALSLCAAAPKSITLPADGTELRSSDLPGYGKARASCVACHSAEYMLYQPPNAGRAYWDAMTKRMKTVFKAPIDDADIPAIVDYLAATYGSKTPPP